MGLRGICQPTAAESVVRKVIGEMNALFSRTKLPKTLQYLLGAARGSNFDLKLMEIASEHMEVQNPNQIARRLISNPLRASREAHLRWNAYVLQYASAYVRKYAFD